MSSSYFLQFSELGFVTLGPFHCARIHLCLCMCILYFVFFHTVLLQHGGVDLTGLKPNP